MLLLEEEATPNDDERGSYCSASTKNAQRLASIIEDRLAFSRSDGRLIIEPVDLNEVITDVREGVETAIDEVEAKFDIETLPTVDGAKVHFRQIFQNLIGDALKYGRADDCRISISCRDSDDGLLLSFDDNGPGIPEASRGEVFDVFKRLHRADEIAGTGLGLSICRKILNQYHGKIWCDESELGGAAMKILLPRANV